MLEVDKYTCYNVKVFVNDRQNKYIGSIYQADLTEAQSAKVAECLNQMFSEAGQNWYAQTEGVED